MSNRLTSEKTAPQSAFRTNWKFVFSLFWQGKLDPRAWRTFLSLLKDRKLDLEAVVHLSELVSEHHMTANEAEQELQGLMKSALVPA